MVEIDGSYLESGGQILRTAVALAAIKKIPCRVFNIRKGRSKPGLMPQHLLGFKTLAQLCNGSLEGDVLGSEEIRFYPGQDYKNQVSIKIKTAGSITLALQFLIPAALFAPSAIKINFDGGATDTFFSPTIDYFRYVFLKVLEKMELKVETNILKRGYYPEGGAKVEIKVFPSKLKALNLTERGRLQRILVVSGSSEFLRNKKVSERQLAGAREVLGKLNLPLEERAEYYQTNCPGSQICLVAEFENTVIGADNLGKFGKRAEDVGKEAALELLKEERSNACLDKHLTDQILLYLALAEKKSELTVSEITNHSKTNIWTIEKSLTALPGARQGKFKIKGNLISWLPARSLAS